jgi:catechol 2,3-dioxygenase
MGANEPEGSAAMASAFAIHPQTTVGPVALIVSDLDRAQRFYRDTLGLRPVAGEPDSVAAAAARGSVAITADGKTPLFWLHGQPGARPRPERTSGLYHVAVLLPDRTALARTLLHLGGARVPLQGAADHRVSEALYLADPDGNGLELYCDRAPETWTRVGGEIRMPTEPLDFDGLLASAAGEDRVWDGLPPATRIGHVHLAMSDLGRAEEFYCGELGFAVTARAGRVALFVSAGGYHHHIGLNIFAGAGVPPPPPDAAGLRHFAIVLPNGDELEHVLGRVRDAGITMQRTGEGVLIRDPAGNGVLLTAPVVPGLR